MVLLSIFALLCSASICGMEGNVKETEDELRREWGEKLYCPLNDYLDTGLLPKLKKRAISLQDMLLSKGRSDIKKKYAEEVKMHYHRVACYVDKQTADTIYSLFPTESAK